MKDNNHDISLLLPKRRKNLLNILRHVSKCVIPFFKRMKTLLGQRLSDPLTGLDKVLQLDVPDVLGLDSGKLVCGELSDRS